MSGLGSFNSGIKGPASLDQSVGAIAGAIAEAFTAASFDPTFPPSGRLRPNIRPVPLERILAALGVAREEIPKLTRAAAAMRLRDWGIDRPDLLEDHTPLAGLLYVTPNGGCIMVRKDDPMPRRRFSAAHELGHFLLHHRPQWLAEDQPDSITTDEPGSVVEEDGSAVGPVLEQQEREANQFAAELLMPAPLCRGLYQFYANTYGDTPTFVEGHIAGDLLVSRQAVRRRLKDLDLARS